MVGVENNTVNSFLHESDVIYRGSKSEHTIRSLCYVKGLSPRGVTDLVSFEQFQCNLQWENPQKSSQKVNDPQSRRGIG